MSGKFFHRRSRRIFYEKSEFLIVDRRCGSEHLRPERVFILSSSKTRGKGVENRTNRNFWEEEGFILTTLGMGNYWRWGLITGY